MTNKIMLRLAKSEKGLNESFAFGIVYLKILNSAGIPLHKSLKSVAKEDYGIFSKEMKKVIANVNVMGKDIASAIMDVAKKTKFSKIGRFLKGLHSTIISGSDLSHFLDFEEKLAIEDLKINLRKKTEQLGIVMEVFSLLFLIAPILLIIVLSILSSIQPQVYGISLPSLMFFISYIILPISGILFLISLDRLI